jgi:hypothetical protein
VTAAGTSLPLPASNHVAVSGHPSPATKKEKKEKEDKDVKKEKKDREREERKEKERVEKEERKEKERLEKEKEKEKERLEKDKVPENANPNLENGEKARKASAASDAAPSSASSTAAASSAADSVPLSPRAEPVDSEARLAMANAYLGASGGLGSSPQSESRLNLRSSSSNVSSGASMARQGSLNIPEGAPAPQPKIKPLHRQASANTDLAGKRASTFRSIFHLGGSDKDKDKEREKSLDKSDPGPGTPEKSPRVSNEVEQPPPSGSESGRRGSIWDALSGKKTSQPSSPASSTTPSASSPLALSAASNPSPSGTTPHPLSLSGREWSSGSSGGGFGSPKPQGPATLPSPKPPPMELPREEPQEFDDPALPRKFIPAPGYAEEGHKLYNCPFDLSLFEQDLHLPYYKPYFFGRVHRNFLSLAPDGEGCVISIEKPDASETCRVLCRTKIANDRFTVPYSEDSKELARQIKLARPALLQKFALTTIVDAELEKELIHLEHQQLVTCYKIGALYAKSGQTENEIYGNVQHSPAFEEFMTLMGEKTPLQGHKGFRGGLDVNKNSTGTHSFYTQFRGYEIMYHVNTMLPYFPADAQHLERKRHVGNDICVLLFFDSPDAAPFDMRTLTSEMNHIFVLVHAEPLAAGETKRRYRISFGMKDTMRPATPFLPWPPILERGQELREFLLTKIINTERQALKSGVFGDKLLKTRRMELQMMAEKYLTRHKAIKKT